MDLVVTRTVPAPPDEVWTAWTTPDGLAGWWWPQLPGTTYAVDARPGGRYRIESPDAGIGVTGELVALDEPRSLTMTWEWLDGGRALPADEVRVVLEPRPSGGTLVTVTHAMADVDDGGAAYRTGWEDVLARLATSRDPRTMAERMRAGDPYIADDPRLEEDGLRARELAAEYNALSPRLRDERRALLVRLLGSIGEGTEVRAPLQVDYGSNITIGARCFVNHGLVALDVAAVTIGDDVQIGPNVQLLTPTHPVDPGPRREKWEAAEPITLGDNVWLGGGVIVCPGVSIGANTVVGAGAVVARDLPADVVAVGNPARIVRTLDPTP